MIVPHEGGRPGRGGAKGRGVSSLKGLESLAAPKTVDRVSPDGVAPGDLARAVEFELKARGLRPSDGKFWVERFDADLHAGWRLGVPVPNLPAGWDAAVGLSHTVTDRFGTVLYVGLADRRTGAGFPVLAVKFPQKGDWEGGVDRRVKVAGARLKRLLEKMPGELHDLRTRKLSRTGWLDLAARAGKKRCLPWSRMGTFLDDVVSVANRQSDGKTPALSIMQCFAFVNRLGPPGTQLPNAAKFLQLLGRPEPAAAGEAL